MKYSIMIVFITAVLVAGCGGKPTGNGFIDKTFGLKKAKNQGSTGGVNLEKYFVRGQISAFYDGATLNPKSFFHDSDLTQFNRFSLEKMVIFEELGERKDNSKSIEEQNRTDSNATKKQHFTRSELNFKFSKIDAKSYMFHPQKIKADKSNHFFLLFKKNQDGYLELYSSYYERVEALHYSFRSDQSVFSIMFRGINKRNGSKYLGVLWFADNQNFPGQMTKVSKDFEYISGSGVGYGWNQDFSFSVCGKATQTELDITEEAIRAWETEPSKLHHLGFKYHGHRPYLPFSDVSENCVFFLNNFVNRQDNTAYTLGATIPIRRNKNEMIAAPILISNGSLQELYKDKWQSQRKRTLVHEMGHALGLGHEFKTISEQSKVKKFPSIMSYNRSIKTVQAHDKAALRALYKKDKLGSDLYSKCVNIGIEDVFSLAMLGQGLGSQSWVLPKSPTVSQYCLELMRQYDAIESTNTVDLNNDSMVSLVAELPNLKSIAVSCDGSFLNKSKKYRWETVESLVFSFDATERYRCSDLSHFAYVNSVSFDLFGSVESADLDRLLGNLHPQQLVIGYKWPSDSRALVDLDFLRNRLGLYKLDIADLIYLQDYLGLKGHAKEMEIEFPEAIDSLNLAPEQFSLCPTKGKFPDALVDFCGEKISNMSNFP